MGRVTGFYRLWTDLVVLGSVLGDFDGGSFEMSLFGYCVFFVQEILEYKTAAIYVGTSLSSKSKDAI